MQDIWVELVLIVAAIMANGVFAGSEIALVSARPSRLAALRQRGVRGAAVAESLKGDAEGFLATIQIAISLVGTLASAVGGAAAVEALTPWLGGLPVPGLERWAEPVALGAVILTITFVSLVVGELTPKSLALRNPERAACLVAPLVRAMQRAAAWPNRVLTRSTRLLLALLGQSGAPSAPLVSEEEVKYLVRQGALEGVFEREESEMLHRVFRFTDTPVRAVMVPRPNILGLDLATPPEEVLARAVEHGRTRLPVFRGSVDDTVGVVVLKDLLGCAARGEPPVLERLLHAPLFVPETAPVGMVLREFQRQRLNLALVVDEHGRVVGLVSMEDIVEEIVGDIRDERGATGLESVRRLPDGSFLIDGTATTRDLRERVELPLEDSPDYQTVAGFVLHRLQAVPRPGMAVTASGWVWTVVDMEGPRVVKVKATREPA